MNHPSFKGHENDGFENEPHTRKQLPEVTCGSVCSINDETWSILSSSDKCEELRSAVQSQSSYLPDTKSIWNNYSILLLGSTAKSCLPDSLPTVMDITFWTVLRNLEETLCMSIQDMGTDDPDLGMMELFSIIAEYDGGDIDDIAHIVEKTEDELYQIYADCFSDITPDMLHDALTYSSLAAEFLYRRGTTLNTEQQGEGSFTDSVESTRKSIITCERTRRRQVTSRRTSSYRFEARS